MIYVVAAIVALVVAAAIARRRALVVPGLVAAGSLFVAVVLFGGQSRAPALLLVPVAALALWFFGFSGWPGTATPMVRKKIYEAAFVAFFAIFAGAVVVWMLGGLGPGIARAIPAVHRQLHAWSGGNQGLVRVHVQNGVCGVEPQTISAGREPTLEFTNADTQERHVEIYLFDPTPLLEQPGVEGVELPPPVYKSRDVAGPAHRVFTIFNGLSPGTLYAWCGSPPAATLSVVPGKIDTGLLPTLARRIANASHDAPLPLIAAIEYVFSILNLALGVLLVRRRPKDRTARLLALGMVGTAAVFNLQAHTIFGITGRTGNWIHLHDLFHVISGVAFVYAVILFPDGRIVPRWRKWWAVWPLRGFYAIATLLVSGLALSGADFSHPAFFVLFFGFLIPVVGVASQGYRLLRIPGAPQRQQSRILLGALVPAAALAVVFVILKATVWSNLTGQRLDDVQAFTFHAFLPVFTFVPAVLLVAILRRRLLDADLTVNRALVFGVLAVVIGAIYVGLVVGIGGTFGDKTVLSIATTVLVAVAFDPVRERVQRLANRLVYGERATPYEAMASLARGVSAAPSIQEVLPATAEAAARGIGAVHARVRLRLTAGEERAASWPDGATEQAWDRTVPIVHGGSEIGEIAVAKAPGDTVTAIEDRLLEALASQAGVALEGLRLAARLEAKLAELAEQTDALTSSRRRIASARDEERRRLERDINREVDRRLVRIGSTLREAERSVGRSRARTTSLLGVVASQAEQTQQALRDLARGIFPPLLADRGVIAAIQGHVRKLGVDAEVIDRFPSPPLRFDSEAEAAVYFCCVEGLRGPRAAKRVRFTVQIGLADDEIDFTIERLGAGGSGRIDEQQMLDRVEALGGSVSVLEGPGRTTVSGWVPAHPADAAQTAASRAGSKRDLET